jgi:SnoaL-like domain
MSPENVEVVRHATQPYDGEDLVPLVTKWVDSFDWSDRDAVAAAVAEDADARHLHPDIEWDAGQLTVPVRGLYGVAHYWADWVADWESYVYRVKEYRDLGSWVLTLADLKAVGRGGIRVEMQSFQMWQVRDGKVSVMRGFLSEAEALEAVGLRE